GVGPYGERELVRLIKQNLDAQAGYAGLVEIKRNPDLLIRGQWALEFKLARPFGDNGVLAEDWSVNLLHPYPGNVSALGDCLKLLEWPGPERRASIVIGYEHEPAQVSLDPLIRSFEVMPPRFCVCGSARGWRSLARAWRIRSTSGHGCSRGRSW